MKHQLTKEQLAKAEELRPYENKWVALVDDKVVASGNSPQEVKREATRKGYKDFAPITSFRRSTSFLFPPFLTNNENL
jgi:hypothetical protein